jgi:hypothetical protein
LTPERGLPIGNIRYLISNAKASAFACPTEAGRLWRDRQMSNECQRPKSKNVTALTLKKPEYHMLCMRLNGQRDLSEEPQIEPAFSMLSRGKASFCKETAVLADGKEAPTVGRDC